MMVFFMTHQEQTEQLTQENQTLKAALALLQARCEQYAQAYDSLKNQIIEMRRHRFGKRSERYRGLRSNGTKTYAKDHQYYQQAG